MILLTFSSKKTSKHLIAGLSFNALLYPEALIIAYYCRSLLNENLFCTSNW